MCIHIYIYSLLCELTNSILLVAIKSILKFKKKKSPRSQGLGQEGVSPLPGAQVLVGRSRMKSQVSEPWNHPLLESQLPSL